MKRKCLVSLAILALIFASCNEVDEIESSNSPLVDLSREPNNENVDVIEEFDLIDMFESEKVVSQIEYCLGKNVNIHEEDLRNIKTITFNNYGDITIKGVEHLTNVEELILKNSQLENFNSLISLDKLLVFEVHNMNIDDLNPLLSSKNLQRLNIYGNSITDISALADMQNLEILEIDFRNIDVDILLQMMNLKKLIIHVDSMDSNDELVKLNQLKNADLVLDLSKYSGNNLSIVSGMKKVKGIILEDAFVSDCSVLLEFDQLEMINANYSGVGNDTQFAEILKKISSLEYVYIEYSTVYNLDFVETLPNIRELNISQMENCNDYSPLYEAVNLEKLVVNGSLYGIQDIDFLKKMKKLHSLDMALNGITNIDALSENANLIYLNLSFNAIEDVGVLDNMLELRELYLYGNNIEDISAISGLTHITKLILADNCITDISSISKLADIKILDLRGNQIEDISVIKEFDKLEYLNIADNPIENDEVLIELGFVYQENGVYYRYLNNTN